MRTTQREHSFVRHRHGSNTGQNVPRRQQFQYKPFTKRHPEPEEHRLVQSAVSTHILAGLLGLMLVCAVASSTLLLPNDLCRIAAKASLLAEPKLLSEYVILTGSE
ncbi:hypothetical protein ETB97_004292 [Aspergillus alliaceus]|uniref:Uncharacterized protein n=1 Tax=Petromyces alliaceus TaxID=209559 RepID=A0A8H6A074_PETAA|nr:hypothetical protein ETB97_004292 [Aspergillus burnettii]